MPTMLKKEKMIDWGPYEEKVIKYVLRKNRNRKIPSRTTKEALLRMIHDSDATKKQLCKIQVEESKRLVNEERNTYNQCKKKEEAKADFIEIQLQKLRDRTSLPEIQADHAQLEKNENLLVSLERARKDVLMKVSQYKVTSIPDTLYFLWVEIEQATSSEKELNKYYAVSRKYLNLTHMDIFLTMRLAN